MVLGSEQFDPSNEIPFGKFPFFLQVNNYHNDRKFHVYKQYAIIWTNDIQSSIHNGTPWVHQKDATNENDHILNTWSQFTVPRNDPILVSTETSMIKNKNRQWNTSFELDLTYYERVCHIKLRLFHYEYIVKHKNLTNIQFINQTPSI